MDVQDDEISENGLRNNLRRIRDPRLRIMYNLGWMEYHEVISIIWNVLAGAPHVVNDHVSIDNRIGCTVCGMGWFQRMVSHQEVVSRLRMNNPFLYRVDTPAPSAGHLLAGATLNQAYYVAMYDRHRVTILRNVKFNTPRVVSDHVPTMPARNCLVCHLPSRVPRVRRLPPSPPQPRDRAQNLQNRAAATESENQRSSRLWFFRCPKFNLKYRRRNN